MQVFKSASKLHETIVKARSDGQEIGFVPTMGALHEGHLSLIKHSKNKNDLTVCSIFVNPTQFNEPADFNKYPRQPDSDIQLLETSDCDILFLPAANEIYPVPDTHIYELGKLAEVLEGAYRAGHFNGVASVVKKLFEIVIPHRGYFGLKDYQQFLVIKRLAEAYSLGVEVRGCQIIREASGLAMSSRNQLLLPEEKNLASEIYRGLKLSAAALKDVTIDEAEQVGRKHIIYKTGAEVEYFSIVHKDSLEPSPSAIRKNLIALTAVRLGKIRLIDNLPIV